jgi:hypothetical protein
MTKQEILKTHKMTEKEFYEKFPTLEAYNQFQMGGSLSPNQKYQGGGFALPVNVPTSLTDPVKHFTPPTTAPAAAAPAAAAPGGFKLPNMSGVSGGGQQAPQQAGADPNAPVQKNIGKTIGSVAGGIAGSFIPIPGVGTMIGGAVGGAIGGAIDKKTYENKMEEYSANKSSQQNAMTSNINGNFNPSAQNKQFKMGGNFTEYHGNTHENGGIPIGKSEVEGGETNHNGYIFSDTLQLGKRTFADVSKKINNKYSRRLDDKISMESKERELGNLMKVQESTGMTNNSRGMFQGGGKAFNPNNPMSEDRATSVANSNALLMNELKFTPPKVVDDGQDYSDMFPKENKPFSKDVEDSILYGPSGDYIGWKAPSKPPTPPTPPGTPPDGTKPLQTKVNPLGYLASAIGPAYNVAQGLKGGDPVNFDRMTSKYQYADPRGAMAAANKGLTSAYNSTKNAARNTTTSAAELLANMSNITSKEGMDRAATMAGIKSQYDMANTQGLNQTNLTKDQFNAQVQMRESEARQQEQDAARSSISQGLNNFGQNTLGYGQDRAMNKTQNTMLPLLADGYEYVIDADGKVSSRKKISTNDSKTPVTPLY